MAVRGGLHSGWKPNSGLGRNVPHVLAQFIADCQNDSLPAVSWVVAPYLYSEHPIGRPVDGAAYVQTMLNALWANPNLAATTVVFIKFDENDGFYDHLVPAPTPPAPSQQLVPTQDAGSIRARALPYQPLANMEIKSGQLLVQMSNHGRATLQLGVYAHHALGDDARPFDVDGFGGSAQTTIAPDALTGAYDVEIHRRSM